MSNQIWIMSSYWAGRGLRCHSATSRSKSRVVPLHLACHVSNVYEPVANIGFVLLPYRARQLHHKESLHPIGYPMRAAVLGTAIKEKHSK